MAVGAFIVAVSVRYEIRRKPKPSASGTLAIRIAAGISGFDALGVYRCFRRAPARSGPWSSKRYSYYLRREAGAVTGCSRRVPKDRAARASSRARRAPY